MLQIICTPLMLFEYKVMYRLFAGTKMFQWVYLTTDAIFYGVFGGLLGLVIGLFSNVLPFGSFFLLGLLLGLMYLLLKELYFWFLRPTRKEFESILHDFHRDRFVIFRSGRWGMHVYMLCKISGHFELEVQYVYRQGWNRCYKPGDTVRGFARKELGLPYRITS